MISFRVSELEFEQLKTESESRGVGSVSDYARLSLCRGRQPDPPDPIQDRIHQLDGKVQNLSTNVERLVSLVERTHDAPNADDEYTPSQRRIVDAQLAEGLADLRAGRTFGPFHSADEMITHMKTQLKKKVTAPKSKRSR